MKDRKLEYRVENIKSQLQDGDRKDLIAELVAKIEELENASDGRPDLVAELKDEIDEKKSEISDLEDKVDELEEQLQDLRK